MVLGKLRAFVHGVVLLADAPFGRLVEDERRQPAAVGVELVGRAGFLAVFDGFEQPVALVDLDAHDARFLRRADPAGGGFPARFVHHAAAGRGVGFVVDEQDVIARADERCRELGIGDGRVAGRVAREHAALQHVGHELGVMVAVVDHVFDDPVRRVDGADGAQFADRAARADVAIDDDALLARDLLPAAGRRGVGRADRAGPRQADADAKGQGQEETGAVHGEGADRAVHLPDYRAPPPAPLVTTSSHRFWNVGARKRRPSRSIFRRRVCRPRADLSARGTCPYNMEGREAKPPPPRPMISARTNTLDIRLPEGVVFSLPLAGPATRFAAWLIDLVLCLAVLAALNLGVWPLLLVSPDVAQALSLVLVFVVPIVYGIAFEAFWRGQTPGKRIFRLRVMDAGGLRLDLRQVIVRNLLRAVDALPQLYLVGGVACLVTARAQRLGDLAADTVVVRTERLPAPDLTQIATGKYNTLRDHPALAARLRQRIGPAEAGLALQALLRRNALEPGRARGTLRGNGRAVPGRRADARGPGRRADRRTARAQRGGRAFPSFGETISEIDGRPKAEFSRR